MKFYVYYEYEVTGDILHDRKDVKEFKALGTFHNWDDVHSFIGQLVQQHGGDSLGYTIIEGHELQYES